MTGVNKLDIIKAIGDFNMNKIICILLVLIMITGVVFAEETSFKLPKYTTADKVAITVVTATLFTIAAIVAKEVVVDGAYGVRK